MAFLFPRLFPVSAMLVVIVVAAAPSLVPHGHIGWETRISAAASAESSRAEGLASNNEVLAGAARESADGASSMPQADDKGRILVDNHINVGNLSPNPPKGSGHSEEARDVRSRIEAARP